MENQKFKVWWDEENQIIRAKFSGVRDEVSAQAAFEEIQKMAVGKINKPSLLVDLTKAGSANAGARKKFVEMAKLDTIKKKAVFGTNAIPRTVAFFVINCTGVTNSKMFDTEEEALKWLKEE